jgi:hypothetical protein
MLSITSSFLYNRDACFLFIIGNAGILRLNLEPIDKFACQYFLLQPSDIDKGNGGLLLPIIKLLFWL